MNTPFQILISRGAVLLLALTSSAFAADPDDENRSPLEGSWRWNFTMPDGSVIRPKLKLLLTNGLLSGVTSYRPGTEAPITNLVVNDRDLRFQVVRRRGDQDVVTTYSGQWSSNAIKGKIESNWAGEKDTFDWDAQRAHIGLEGIWRWTNTFFGRFGGPGGRGGGDRNADRGGGDRAESNTNRPNRDAASDLGGRGGGGRGSGGRGGRGGGRGGFDTRVELEQEGDRITGKTVARFGRSSSITNGFFTNSVIYFEIERVFGEIRSITKHQGKQFGDVIKGTMESEVEGEDRTIEWEATRMD